MIIKVNLRKYDLLFKIAEQFGKLTLQKREVTELHLNPVDFYTLRLNSTFYQQFDPETQRKLRVDQNIIGYLWGSVVKFSDTLAQGEVRFLTRKRAEPTKKA